MDQRRSIRTLHVNSVRVDSLSNKGNADFKKHTRPGRSTASLAAAALEDNWTTTAKPQKVIRFTLLFGSLIFFITGAYSSIQNISSSSFSSSSSSSSFATAPFSTASHSIDPVVLDDTSIQNTSLPEVPGLKNVSVVDVHRFALPTRRADASTLTKQPRIDVQTKTKDVQTKTKEPLPQCLFPKMEITELPAQHKQEYLAISDFTMTPHGAVPLHGIAPSVDYGVCVNNPLMQRLTGRGNNTPMKSLIDPKLIEMFDINPKIKNTICLPECASKTTKTGTISQLKEDPLWVISMQTNTTTLSEVNFRKAGFKPELVSGVNGREMFKNCEVGELPAGVLGIRLSFRKLLLRALHESHERVIIVEDDVVLEDDFSDKLHHKLQTHRCGGFMFDDSTGGVLLLGSSEYGGVGMIKGGLDHHRDKCYNVNGLTYGAYASVYHRNVFLPILAWLDAPEFAAFPLDHIWSHLALRGFIVRALKPMAALADVIHSSSTQQRVRTPVDQLDTAMLLWRACLMRWDLQHFEHYRNVLESRHLFGFTNRRDCHRTKKTQTNYRYVHSAVVLIHANPNLLSLSSLANILVSRWRAKLDGRYEGYIARPFVVIKAPPGMPPMETSEILSVVRSMRTQSFNAHVQRVEQALELASFSSSQDEMTVAGVVRKLVLEALAPVLVLDTKQLEELKLALFHQPIAQMYIELRTQTPWVPTDAQMIDLLATTKPRGRHWYKLNIDPTQFAKDGEQETGSESTATIGNAFPLPELVQSWSDALHTASHGLEMVHKYADTAASISQQILGLSQHTFLSEKEAARSSEEKVNEHVAAAELLCNKVQARKEDLDISSAFANDILQHAKQILELMKTVKNLKNSIRKHDGFLVEAN